MNARFGLPLLCLFAVLALGVTAFGSPYFLIDSASEWQGALSSGKISPMASAQWGDYMLQWGVDLEEGGPYPPNEFVPASLPYGQLYMSPGGSPGYPSDAGLVMVWQPRSPTTPGSYSSAWKYHYGADPNLNNCTINVTVTPPQFGLTGQINAVSFGIQDINGNIRAWYWNCGPGGLPWNVPTTITINTALTGLAAANPVATGYANNPLFSLANSQSFIVDENVQWVGGPMPVPPPPGQLPGVWNYWHNLVVTPNIQPKYPDPVKWSQPVVEVTPPTTPPTFNGWDERSMYYQQPICADDWECTDPRPVTDIHWWGSFIGWTQPDPPPLPTAFHIGIWTDVPANPPNIPFSHPGTLVWQNYCTSYVWNFAGYDRDPRGTTTNEACFQFNQWLQPSEYFYQDPGPTGRNVYWVSIAAVYPTGQTPQYPWGWKTRPHFFNDDAVRITQVTPAWPPAIGSTWAAGTHITYPTDVSWDLAFELTTNQEQHWDYDWGDAPDNLTAPQYPTLAANGGANHMIVPGMFLGAQIDAETDGQPYATTALGDDLAGVDDEDGVVFTSPLVPGNLATIDVTASMAGMLDAWVDFDQDGDWADAGEQVFASQPLVAGVNSLSFVVPATAPSGNTFARFRYSTAGGLSYTGPAADGEVEDYQVAISCYKWEQPPDLSTQGFDVLATAPNILADDFRCDMQGPITDIHVYSSWYGDQLPLGDANQVVFTLSIHTDIPDPDGPGPLYSTPGVPLWSRTFGPGQFTVRPYRQGLQEGWLTPPDIYQPIADTTCWRYDFYLNPGEFYQEGTPTAPVTYWLDVQAQPLETGRRFGWKTSTRHWNDDGVWGQGAEPFYGPWSGDLRYPPGHPKYPQSLDLAFDITGDCWQQQELDWGDAPDPTYPTLAASNGARHVIVPGMRLGALIDAEADGQPTPIADGDDINGVDDEDGVVFTTPLVPGAPATVVVTASTPGMLDAWVDFNGDGDWADPGEQIFAASMPLVAGPNTLTFTVPIGAGISGANMPTFARFRYSSTGGLSYTGLAPDGEVEDYQVRIYPRPVIVTKSKAKCLPVGSYVLIKKDIVTANFGQFWYFEEPTRFAALGVIQQPNGPASAWVPGDMVSCYGFTDINGCELMLQELYSWNEGTGFVAPLGQNNRDSGGGAFCNQPGLVNRAGPGPAVSPAVGLNSVAMLVTLWGRCTCIEDAGGVQTNFWIDDGSNLWDGLCQSNGVMVRVPPGSTGAIASRKYYSVTGIMRTYATPTGGCVRYLWPRSAADIVLVPEP